MSMPGISYAVSGRTDAIHNSINATPTAVSGDNRQRLELFFQQQEQRALKFAAFSTRNHADAADLVQETMLRFVRKYSHRAPSEWPPLFHRILQNCMIDWQRRQTVRNRFRSWLKIDDGEPDQDPLAQLPDTSQPGPEQQLSGDQIGSAINHALRQLPLRQRQAFLLRNWQGLSVAETAIAMECGQGSVKTHLSRALTRLRNLLAEYQQENG